MLSEAYTVIEQILREYPIMAPFLFILIRMVPILFPPLPGVAVDIIGIALFGWKQGSLLACIAILVSSMMAFALGRCCREPLMARFISLKRLYCWEERVSKEKRFWGFVLLRAVTGPVSDYVSYAAGLTKIRTHEFFLATVIGMLPIVVAFYYFGGLSFEQGVFFIVGFLVVISCVSYFSKKTWC